MRRTPLLLLVCLLGLSACKTRPDTPAVHKTYSVTITAQDSLLHYEVRGQKFDTDSVSGLVFVPNEDVRLYVPFKQIEAFPDGVTIHLKEVR